MQAQVVSIDRKNSLDQMVQDYAANKKEIERLSQINDDLAEILLNQAAFKDSSNTGHLEAGGYKVTVTCRLNTRWDNAKLNAARDSLGDDLFFQVFKAKFEPHSKKDLDSFLALAAPEYREPVLAAMTTSPGKPAIKLEV